MPNMNSSTRYLCLIVLLGVFYTSNASSCESYSSSSASSSSSSASGSSSVSESHCSSSSEEGTSTSDCSKTPCNDYTVQEVIVKLWDLPKKLSSLETKLKDEIINLIPGSDDEQLAYLLSTSLWGVDWNTGFSPSVSPSCTFLKVIESSLRVKCEGLEEALTDLGVLASAATEYTIHVGLTAAKCTRDKPDKVKTKRCPPNDDFNKFLETTDSIPGSIKEIISELSQSDDRNEVIIAMAATASGTEASLRLFKALLERSELLELVQLKACNIKIPPDCCPVREQELRDRADALSAAVMEVLPSILESYDIHM